MEDVVAPGALPPETDMILKSVSMTEIEELVRLCIFWSKCSS